MSDEKLRQAKELLGERYLCHPTNHVKKSPRKGPEIDRTDIRKTFARVRREQAEREKREQQVRLEQISKVRRLT